MPSTLELPPEVAAKIAVQAAERGVPIEEYVRLLVAEQEGKVESRPTPSRQTPNPQERARLWREWAESHDPDTPLLSDEAISRESIYQERG
jgi:hypothetical protein